VSDGRQENERFLMGNPLKSKIEGGKICELNIYSNGSIFLGSRLLKQLSFPYK